MISNLEAAGLGIVQGLTEFLPVSSSAHLIFAQHFFGVTEEMLFFDVLLHAATFLATIVVFRTQVAALLNATTRLPTFISLLFQKGHLAIGDDPEAWTVVLILFTTAVTGTIGIAFHDVFEQTFSSVVAASVGLLLTGTLLISTRGKGSDEPQSVRRPTGSKTPVRATLKDALLIGLAQGCAIYPGLSRSGTTISVGLFVGFHRKFAGEYSFLISLPVIAGAIVLESRKGFDSLEVGMTGVAIGFVTAFIAGILSLTLLLRWIRSGKLHYFAPYCWLAGAIGLYVSLVR